MLWGVHHWRRAVSTVSGRLAATQRAALAGARVTVGGRAITARVGAVAQRHVAAAKISTKRRKGRRSTDTTQQY